MATVLEANNLAKASKGLEIEERILNFAKSVKDGGWGCDDDVDGPRKVDRLSLVSSCRHQGMPQRIIDTLSGDLIDTDAYATVKKFIEAPRDGWCLVLSGPKGCGKSTAAAYYLWEKTKQAEAELPKDRRWWTASRVARVSGFNDQLENMMKLPVMVIDDLGVEYLDKNGYFNHRLDELIDERYSNYRKTIITTNLNPEDFQSRYEQRVTDRIRQGFKHGGDYACFNPEGKSLRA